MTLASHTRLCAFVSIVGVLAAGLGIYQDMEPANGRRWLAFCGLSLLVSFMASQLMDKLFSDSESGAKKIGDSKFERHAIFVTVWLPLALSAAAVVGIYFLQMPAEKVEWMAIAVSAIIGHHLSNLRNFAREK